MRPFDISQDEYEQELRDLENEMERVGALTDPTVPVGRHQLLQLIQEVYAHGIAAYENYTGSAWKSRPILINAEAEATP